MEELYVEGLATRGGPELCVASRKGRGEALTGHVQAGLLSREIPLRGAHVVQMAEGNIPGRVIASGQGTPRGPRSMACTEPPCARTGRARVRPSALVCGRAAWGTPRR